MWQRVVTPGLRLAFVLALFAAACADDGDARPDVGGTPDDTPTDAAKDEGTGDDTGADDAGDPPADPNGDDAAYLSGDSSVIFDQSQLHTFELTLSEENLAFLDGDPTAEEYVEGSLTFNGETIDRVGIRYKGSIGGFVGCTSEFNFGDLRNIGGEKTCTKISMKVKINWEDTDDTFFGLKKLQFHAMNNDPTMLRERLGYHLFREMDIAAPRAVHARLVVNGEFVGLFALIEQIDGRFTRENWDDGSGNLYKEVWPVLNDEPATDDDLFAGLKTNEDEDPTYGQIQGFASAILDADEAGRRDAIRDWMSVEEIASYVAVDRTIRNDDGAFHIYCGGPFDGCRPHNFYWYEEPTAETMHLIPWDLDHAFSNLIRPENPVTPLADEFGEISNNCEPISSFAGFSQISSACDPLMATFASFDDEINAKKAEFLAGPFAPETVDALLEAWTAQIRDAVIEADQAHADAAPETSWDRSVDYFRDQLAWARDQIS